MFLSHVKKLLHDLPDFSWHFFAPLKGFPCRKMPRAFRKKSRYPRRRSRFSRAARKRYRNRQQLLSIKTVRKIAKEEADKNDNVKLVQFFPPDVDETDDAYVLNLTNQPIIDWLMGQQAVNVIDRASSSADNDFLTPVFRYIRQVKQDTDRVPVDPVNDGSFRIGTKIKVLSLVIKYRVSYIYGTIEQTSMQCPCKVKLSLCRYKIDTHLGQRPDITYIPEMHEFPTNVEKRASCKNIDTQIFTLSHNKTFHDGIFVKKNFYVEWDKETHGYTELTTSPWKNDPRVNNFYFYRECDMPHGASTAYPKITYTYQIRFTDEAYST